VIKLWEKNFEPFFCNTDSLNTSNFNHIHKGTIKIVVFAAEERQDFCQVNQGAAVGLQQVAPNGERVPAGWKSNE